MTFAPGSASLLLTAFHKQHFPSFQSQFFFIHLHLLQNENIHSVEGRRKKIHWTEWASFTHWCLHNNLPPHMSSWFFSYIVCILMAGLTREKMKKKNKKNDMWQAIHLSCQHVIFTTFKPHVMLLLFLHWWRWPRSQPANTPTHSRWIQWQQSMSVNKWQISVKCIN